MKTNKEIADKLTEYFKDKCDIEAVCRCLANMMIDMRRIRHSALITPEEMDSLQLRMIHNDMELSKFVKSGGNMPPMKLHIYEEMK